MSAIFNSLKQTHIRTTIIKYDCLIMLCFASWGRGISLAHTPKAPAFLLFLSPVDLWWYRSLIWIHGWDIFIFNGFLKRSSQEIRRWPGIFVLLVNYFCWFIYDQSQSKKINQSHWNKVNAIVVSCYKALCHTHSNAASDCWLEHWMHNSPAPFYGANRNLWTTKEDI